MYANYSKEVYSLCVAPPTPTKQESRFRGEGGLYPFSVTQARQSNCRVCQAATVLAWQCKNAYSIPQRDLML